MEAFHSTSILIQSNCDSNGKMKSAQSPSRHHVRNCESDAINLLFFFFSSSSFLSSNTCCGNCREYHITEKTRATTQPVFVYPTDRSAFGRLVQLTRRVQPDLAQENHNNDDPMFQMPKVSVDLCHFDLQ
jgi:hypothetical protein